MASVVERRRTVADARKLRLFAVDLALLVSLLFRESGPGLSHFDQQGLIRLIRSLPSQAKAFGRTPLVILEFGHATLCLARNAADVTFVPSPQRGRRDLCSKRAKIIWWMAIDPDSSDLGGERIVNTGPG
jgi:hypothetical protein